MEKLITFIVPIYKIKEEYLRKCIESLLSQNLDNYHIILVDDGSPDNCGVICEEYSKKSNSIHVIYQDNLGVSAARNKAIEITNSDWIIFVDADDWVDCNYTQDVELLINGLQKNEPDIIMLAYYKEYKDGKELIGMHANDGFLSQPKYREVRKAAFYKLSEEGTKSKYEVVNIWNKVYKTDFIKMNHLEFVLEARKGQDQIFNAEALNCTNNIYYVGRAYYHYRCLQESRTNRYDPQIIKLTNIELECLKKIIRKYNLEDICGSSLEKRTCTKIYACLRLDCFNPNNINGFLSKMKNAIELIDSEPYRSALENVKVYELTGAEKAFVLLLKIRCIPIVYFLVTNKDRLFRKRLN